jgi:hypothetical protein
MANIDRVFCSTNFDSRFPVASARTLPRVISDHVPILWDSGEEVKINGGRFKVEKWWLNQDEFTNIVRQVGAVEGKSALDRWQNMIRILRRKAKGWNRNKESEIKKEKQQMKVEPERLDILAESRDLSRLEKERVREVSSRLEIILDIEEIKARQHSRVRNMKEGDRNTKYFHAVANQRKRKTTIYDIEGPEGAVNSTGDIIKVGTQYYKDLFKFEPRPNINIFSNFSFEGGGE